MIFFIEMFESNSFAFSFVFFFCRGEFARVKFFVFFFLYREGDNNLSFDKMVRNLMRLRSKFMPKSPTTAAEIALNYSDTKIMSNFGYSWVRDCESIIMFYFANFIFE